MGGSWEWALWIGSDLARGVRCVVTAVADMVPSCDFLSPSTACLQTLVPPPTAVGSIAASSGSCSTLEPPIILNNLSPGGVLGRDGGGGACACEHVACDVGNQSRHYCCLRLSPSQTLTLNRPGRLNAFSNDSYRLLGTHLNDAAKDAGVKCVVLTGAGPFHSSGAWVAQL